MRETITESVGQIDVVVCNRSHCHRFCVALSCSYIARQIIEVSIMKPFFSTVSAVLLILFASTTFAADKTITLSVPDMNRPSCPYMVEQSISFVEGVQSAKVELETRTCSVTFDDAIASVEDILGTTADIGNKSSVVTPGDGS